MFNHLLSYWHTLFVDTPSIEMHSSKYIRQYICVVKTIEP